VSIIFLALGQLLRQAERMVLGETIRRRGHHPSSVCLMLVMSVSSGAMGGAATGPRCLCIALPDGWNGLPMVRLAALFDRLRWWESPLPARVM